MNYDFFRVHSLNKKSLLQAWWLKLSFFQVKLFKILSKFKTRKLRRCLNASSYEDYYLSEFNCL